MTLFLFISMAFADCSKEIKVLAYREKALPSLFDLSKKRYVEGEKNISISCELYSTIKIGDTLEGENIEIGVEDFFTGGIVEKQYYKVLSK